VNPRLWELVERIETLSPAVSRRAVGTFLRVASPFNAPLKAELEIWEPLRCRVRVKNRRALHNHLRGIHAGALVTAGETPAGLLILRSFPFSRYRLILKDLSVAYERQARTDLVSEATLTAEQLAQAKVALEAGEPAVIAVETAISEPGGERLALVRTSWQVKPWEHVRARA
jgi:acyl-coenzyme A thioesterase PaaI-like protein